MKLRGMMCILIPIAVLLLMLTGCVPKGSIVPSQQAIDGTWLHDGIDGSSKIVLTGSMIALTAVPTALIDATGKYARPSEPPSGIWEQTRSASGACDPPSGPDGGAYPFIHCGVSGSGFRLYYDSYTQDEPVLVLIYGDDLQYRYEFHRN